jgi:hypothetical protein
MISLRDQFNDLTGRGTTVILLLLVKETLSEAGQVLAAGYSSLKI